MKACTSDPAAIRAVLVTSVALLVSLPLPAETYYVDSHTGDDGNPGTSPHVAWKTLDRIARAELSPGDRVLLAGGRTFPGTLRLSSKHGGTKERPLMIASFGQGRATLDGARGDALVLVESACVVIKDLNLAGCGRKNGNDGSGVRLERTRNVSLDALDIRGFRIAGVSTRGDDGTRITRVYAHDNGSAGIECDSGEGTPRSRNLYVGNCVAENNPGDPKELNNHSGNGIVLGGLDGGLVECCEALNNGWDMPRKGNGPVGIWGWNCDRLTIQCCVSHDNKSPGKDGGGFDFDGGVTNSVMQYNLSYGNAGCGYLLCQYAAAPTWKNNTLRYNVSFNDGAQNFESGIGIWTGPGGISDAQVYNNTIVNPKHAVVAASDMPGVVYRNNVFLAGENILDGDFTHSRFEHNLYWSTGGERSAATT